LSFGTAFLRRFGFAENLLDVAAAVEELAVTVRKPRQTAQG
jgi:hypothetical protein